MTEAWKNWEGQIVDGHVLRAYLGGSDHSGVFLTDHGHPEPHEAAIKLIVADPANAEFQLSQWEIAANLALSNRPHRRKSSRLRARRVHEPRPTRLTRSNRLPGRTPLGVCSQPL